MERTLSEFLRNGRLGGLQFGASKADVRRVLGTDAAGGALRLSFDRGRLAAIALVFREPLPRELRLAGWWPTRATTFRELRDYLDRETIPYRMAIPTDAQILVRAGAAGVRFSLEGTRTSLESIQAQS